MKKLFVLLALPFLLLSGCKNLAPGGAYEGDQYLYAADAVISTSYEAAHTFVKWEYDYRNTITWPQVKEFANFVRLNYPTYHRAAMAARSQYILSKTVESKKSLELTLDVLRSINTQISQWYAQVSSLPNTKTPIEMEAK